MSVPSQNAAKAKPSDNEILRIDEVCDRFERALRSGDHPDIAEALQGFEDESRSALLGELFLLELDYQRESHPPEGPLAERIRESHPELSNDLNNALDLIKHRIGFDSSLPSRTESFDNERQLSSETPVSRFFEVPCPNCYELCSVAADSNSDDVTCNLCGSTFNLSENSLKTEDASALTTVGHFRLTTRLGMGGCGTVWKAYDSQLDRTVAVKIPRSGRLTSEEEERFLREARAVARLKHPNIVPIHEFGRDGDLLYFVADYVRGVSLDAWLTAKKPPLRQAAELVATLAKALQYAHEQGVIHRDVKPSNVLMDAYGSPHLTDFGLAMLNRPGVSHDEDGLLGTPAYMSPEQAAGEAHRCDERTDVYALGVMLFQMLTSELPFRGNREMLLFQIQFDDPVSPRKLSSSIPRDLETICLKCLQKPMSARYDSAREVAEDLERFLHGLPIAARPVSFPVRAWRWCGRNRPAAAALALLIFIGVVTPPVAVYQATLRQRAEQAEAETRRFYKQFLAQGRIPAPNPGGLDARPVATNPSVFDQKLTESAHNHTVRRIRILESDTPDAEEQAYMHLAVALLAGAEGKPEEAVGHLEQAAEALNQLRTDAPEEQRYEAALAYCKSRLVRYYTALDHFDPTPATLLNAEQASRAWQELAGKYPKDFFYQRNFADSQLWESLALGEQRAALDTVKQGAEVIEQIEARWPNDGKQLYEIACELTNNPPLLVPQLDSTPSLK